jgi:ABC-type dipeptide/oligopeptide/nickel transport system permease subunit
MHLLFTRTQIYLAAVQLRNREPEISSWWWPLFAVLIVAMSCLSWNFLAQPATIRALLRKIKGQPIRVR